MRIRDIDMGHGSADLAGALVCRAAVLPLVLYLSAGAGCFAGQATGASAVSIQGGTNGAISSVVIQGGVTGTGNIVNSGTLVMPAAPEPRKPKLEITEVIASQATEKGPWGMSPISTAANLDIRLHNKGTAGIAISQVRLSVLDFTEQELSGAISGNEVLPTTGVYCVDLSQMAAKGRSTNLVLSAHYVGPDKGERFAIIAAATRIMGKPLDRKLSWRLGMTLITDFGEVPGPDIKVTFPVPLAKASAIQAARDAGAH